MTALRIHYSDKSKGDVWAGFDYQKRKYYIRGEGLEPHPDLKQLYPNGWSLLDFFTPKEARKIAKNYLEEE